jgi:PAS domain S-box-containing protein
MTHVDHSISLILETLPLPAFLARYDGTLAHANEALLSITGQPDLVNLDRTLFGLGIFNNPAEYRGFISSFRYGGRARRLVLPVGRLKNSDRPLVLFASLIDFEGREAVCGIISRTSIPADVVREGNETDEEILLDKVEGYVVRIDDAGNMLFTNLSLLVELGMSRMDASLPKWTNIDVELDEEKLAQYQATALNRGSVRYETSLQRKDGSLIPVEAVLKPIRKVIFKGQFLITAFNLSVRREEQREREEMQRELEKLQVQLARRTVLVNEKFREQESSFRIITKSQAYEKVLRQITQVATTDSTVLITGETGTGKELIARSIHARSLRASRPLLILNCGALPADLIESELFGYRKGAFTGARTDHLGRFELADEGTLFLDEIGEMPMLLQTRLLRVLQDGEFTPLGAKESVNTDVRIIAATNRNLRDRVADGTFRADLYFRLNVFPIHSPPLRERPEDIPLLAEHFIRKHGKVTGLLPKLRAEDIKRLQGYPFDGNVRELENIIQRALILSDGEYLHFQLEKYNDRQRDDTDVPTAPEILNFTEMQRNHIIRVLDITGGKVSGEGGAAQLLDLNPQTLFSKMRKLKISRRKERYS